MKCVVAALLIVCKLMLQSAYAQHTKPAELRTQFGMNVVRNTNEASWPMPMPGDSELLVNGFILNPHTYDYHNMITTGRQLLSSPDARYELYISYKSYNPNWHITKKEWERGWMWSAEGMYKLYYGSYTPMSDEDNKIYAKWKVNLKNNGDNGSEYFPIAVLDNGALITTKADDFRFHFNADAPEKSYLTFGTFEGLYGYDPVTKQTRTINKDASFEADPQHRPFRLTQDAQLIVSEERLDNATRIQSYNLGTGEHYAINLAKGSELRLLGNRTAVVYEKEGGGRLRMISLKDGSELLQAPITASSGFAYDPQFRNVNLHGDELFFYNVLNNSIAGLKPVNGKMEAASVVPLDTAGALVKGGGYYLGVARDYFMLVPGSIPASYDTLKPYPLFAWGFSRKDGKAIWMLAPFYEQRKSQTEIAQDEDRKCKELYERSPFKSGSHVMGAGGQVLIWDILCSCNCYRVRNMNTYEYWANPANYTKTDKPIMGRCPMCNGRGQYYKNVLVQDDSWKASGLGFYYRTSADVKEAQQLTVCPKCNGTGLAPE